MNCTIANQKKSSPRSAVCVPWHRHGQRLEALVSRFVEQLRGNGTAPEFDPSVIAMADASRVVYTTDAEATRAAIIACLCSHAKTPEQSQTAGLITEIIGG